jgi:hypothetical protein
MCDKFFHLASSSILWVPNRPAVWWYLAEYVLYLHGLSRFQLLGAGEPMLQRNVYLFPLQPSSKPSEK